MISPAAGEIIVDKTKSSAFSATNLADLLRNAGVERLILVGFTANECIDATARQSSEDGFETIVISDATASFDVAGHDGQIYRADRIHQLTMANLHALYAKVMTTEVFAQQLR